VEAGPVAALSASLNGTGPRWGRSGATEIQSAAAVAAAAAGTSHRAVRLCHHRRRCTTGSVCIIAASVAWQRSQPAEWLSAAASSSRPSDPSIHAASVSGSRQAPAGGAPWPARSLRRSSRSMDRSVDAPDASRRRSLFT
jgi:hypothetical protein